MKLLYVNGTYEGGSILSTRELLTRLPGHGVESRLISAQKETAVAAYLRRRMTNLAVKVGGPEPDNSVERGQALYGCWITWRFHDYWNGDQSARKYIGP